MDSAKAATPAHAAPPLPGIHPGVPEPVYRSWPLLSASLVKEGTRSLAHLKRAVEAPERSSAAMVMGSAFHCAVLEPDRFRERYWEAPKVDRRTREGKAAWAEAEKAATGQPLSLADIATIGLWLNAVRRHPAARRLLELPGAAECAWVARLEGQLCKGRVDWMAQPENEPTIVVDLKTAQDASPRGFQRAITRYRYDLQAAMYLDGLDAVHQAPRRFVWIVVEKARPYNVAVYEADPLLISAGRHSYRKVLQAFAAATESGEWPGYSDKVEPISLPAWAQDEALDGYGMTLEETGL